MESLQQNLGILEQLPYELIIIALNNLSVRDLITTFQVSQSLRHRFYPLYQPRIEAARRQQAERQAELRRARGIIRRSDPDIAYMILDQLAVPDLLVLFREDPELRQRYALQFRPKFLQYYRR